MRGSEAPCSWWGVEADAEAGVCEAEAEAEVAAEDGVLEVWEAGVLEGVAGMLGCCPPRWGGCMVGMWEGPIPEAPATTEGGLWGFEGSNLHGVISVIQ